MQHDLLDRHRSLRILVGLVIVVVAIYIVNVIWNVLATFGDIFLLFFLAWVITFILDPVSSYLVRRGFSRVLAVSLVYLALLVVVSGLIVLAVPAVQAQVAHLATQIQSELSGPNLNHLSAGVVRALERVGFSPKDAQNVVSQLITQIPQKTQQATNQAISSASTLLSTIGTFLFDASIVVIISFYMMLDGGRLIESLCNKLPPSWEPDLRLFQGYINDIFGGFFRAQIIVAGLYALATWITTWIVLTVPSGGGAGTAFLAAVLAGLFMLLPFIGAFLAVVPPALLVVIQTPPDILILKLVILIFLLGAWQHVVLNLIAPRVYGHHVGMDPIILFAALLLGAKIGGVWGAFFSIPIVAILYAIFETFYDRWTSNHPLFQVEEHIEERIREERPFEETAREVRPRIVPVRTTDVHQQVGPGTRGENPPPITMTSEERAAVEREAAEGGALADATGTDGLLPQSGPRAGNGALAPEHANGTAAGMTAARGTPPASASDAPKSGANGTSGASSANGTTGLHASGGVAPFVVRKVEPGTDGKCEAKQPNGTERGASGGHQPERRGERASGASGRTSPRRRRR